MPELHAAFTDSGKKEGLEIWRIEDFEPIPVPSQHHGKFFTGDSYIVLKTTGTGVLSWDIHFWLGSSTTQDEAGAAAILTVNLDDGRFEGAAVQHREVQGYESKQFLGYFPNHIRYLAGGHASGFSHVTTNAGAAEKTLFQIKGKRNVRVKQVEASIDSMNKGDCFILDVDHDIYLYVGEKAKNIERLKAISVANQIRDQDHSGRGNIEIIDPFSSDEDFDKFFKALGSGDKDSVPADIEGGDDEEFESEVPQEVTLSEISDSTGEVKITALPKPLSVNQLNTNECYILDTGSSGIYVWVGRKSTTKEKSEAMSKANHYLKIRNYPDWVHVTKIPEDTEHTSFIQYFDDWK